MHKIFSILFNKEMEENIFESYKKVIFIKISMEQQIFSSL